MAPAMNSNMLAHPAVKQNLAALTARGVRFVEPGEGYLACGWIGKGRLAEPESVVEAAEAVLRDGRRLTGRRIVVTAGPTQEDLDPVRFVGNRSSGRMGFAIAAALAERGSDVVLIAGPSTVEPPATTKVVRVRSAADMRQAVLDELPGADALVMAAAVANYTSESVADEKIPHDTGPLTIRLVPTVDILAEAASWRERQGGRRPLLVGFAAESGDVLSRARAKRLRKGIDVIVANDVSRTDAGFEVDRNEVTIITADGEELLPLQSKQAIAAALADRLERWLSGQAAPAEMRPQ
jgi:phosphopantothenoylcysteine decarboxylase/phosphopantothenate--cysteine ligase